MSMMEAVKSVFHNYANFHGRARRSEYWLFTLFNGLICFGMTILIVVLAGTALADDKAPGGAGALGVLYWIYGLAVILPSLAVSCRRLHDTGRSGAYLLFAFIPVVGGIFLLIWLIEDGTPGGNIYGPDPKNRSGEQGYAPPPQVGRPPENRGYGDSGSTAVPPVREYNRAPVLRAESGAFQGRSFPVQGRLSMGRSPENTLVFPQETTKVSRKHCEFSVNDGRLFVQDMGSSNGTVINKSYRLMPGQTVELHQGDCVSLGSLNDTFTVV